MHLGPMLPMSFMISITFVIFFSRLKMVNYSCIVINLKNLKFLCGISNCPSLMFRFPEILPFCKSSQYISQFQFNFNIQFLPLNISIFKNGTGRKTCTLIAFLDVTKIPTVIKYQTFPLDNKRLGTYIAILNMLWSTDLDCLRLN